jgi:hypothetical protein
VSGALFLERNRIKFWIEERLIRGEIRRLERLYPIKVTEFEFDAPWADLLNGKIADLRITVEWQLDSHKWRAKLKGPLHITEVKGAPDLHLEYSAATLVESGGHSFPMRTELWVGLKNFQHFTEFGVTVGGAKIMLPSRGFSVENFVLDGTYDGEEFDASLSAKKLTWNDPARPEDSPHILQVDDFELDAQNAEGETIEAQIKSRKLEGIWSDTPFSAPLFSVPAYLRLNPRSKHALLHLGSKQPFSLVAELNWETLVFNWESQMIPIAPLIPNGAELPVKISRGFLHSQGHGNLKSFEADLDIKDLDFQIPGSQFTFRGLQLSLPFRSGGIRDGAVSIRELWFKRLKGGLGHTDIKLLPLSEGWKFSLGKKSVIPLHFENLDLKIAALEGVLKKPVDDKPFEADLKSAFTLEPVTLPSLAKNLCQDESKVPPATLSVQFPEISITQNSIVPEGGLVRMELFGGAVELSELELYDFLTAVPELNFDLHWGKIDVSKFARWTSFGRMDGYLQGYAEEVKVLSWLPTHFDFRIEIVPHRQSNIVFSSNAMRNFVRLFARNELEQMPGIAQWFYFGTPGQIFDYSADYVGFKAFSDSGSILLETLDPETAPLTEKKQNHYILYGTRFKMVLNGSRYPVVVDARATANFVRHVTETLKIISQEGKQNDDTESSSEKAALQNCLP